MHWKEKYGEIFRQRTGLGPETHVATHLISAKTGYGVEEFISDVWRKWKTKGGWDMSDRGPGAGGRGPAGDHSGRKLGWEEVVLMMGAGLCSV